jgi:hypothetical protein
MNKYKELKDNPPAIEVNKNAREVIFKTISCMCDNVRYLTFKKNQYGDFKLYGNGYSTSNWQMQFERFELEWIADNGQWDDVVRMINTGTSKIASVISR